MVKFNEKSSLTLYQIYRMSPGWWYILEIQQNLWFISMYRMEVLHHRVVMPVIYICMGHEKMHAAFMRRGFINGGLVPKVKREHNRYMDLGEILRITGE